VLSGNDRVTKLKDVANRLQNNETPRAWVMAVNQVHGLAKNLEANLPLNVYIRMQDLKFA